MRLAVEYILGEVLWDRLWYVLWDAPLGACNMGCIHEPVRCVIFINKSLHYASIDN